VCRIGCRNKYSKNFGGETSLKAVVRKRSGEKSILKCILIKQVESVQYFSYLGSIITNDTRCTREIKPRIARAKAAFKRKKTLFTSRSDLNLRKKVVKC
jgi:hypothetical protein